LEKLLGLEMQKPKQCKRMMYNTNLTMSPQIISGANDPGVTITGELTGNGTIANTTFNAMMSYGNLSRQKEVSTSPFISGGTCDCNTSRNVDGKCISGSSETKPYEEQSEAQQGYLNSLWDSEPYMNVGPVDRYTMLREAPKRMPFLPDGPMLR
jgi:hypothetical protein